MSSTRIRTLVIAAVAAVLAAGCGTDDRKAESAPPKGKPAKEEQATIQTPAAVKPVVERAKKAGCDFERPRLGKRTHLGEGDHPGLGHNEYTSDPPTSGQHFGTTGEWGYYTKQLQDEYALHNLEHGGTVVWYGGSDAGALEPRIATLLKDHPKTVISPRKSLDEGEWALTSWGLLLRCGAEATGDPKAFGPLLADWVKATQDAAWSPEPQVPAIVAGTRHSRDEYTGDDGSRFAALPEPPHPKVNSTQKAPQQSA